MTQHDARLIIFDSFVSLFATELVSGFKKTFNGKHLLLKKLS